MSDIHAAVSPLIGKIGIRTENPLAVLLVLAVLVASVVVLPLVKTQRFRLTAAKLTALLIVVGYCVYLWSLLPSVVFLWPLSFIWFPEYWGSFTGFIRGPYINRKSPPIVVAGFGWFFLTVFPLFLLWVSGQLGGQ